MRSALVHGLLLAAALVTAYQVRTAESGAARRDAGTLVWQGAPEDVREVRYRTDARALRIVRREEDGERFLWAYEMPGEGGAPATDGARPDSEAVRAGGGSAADTTEYPVGRDGEQLVDGLARLRAMRVLDPGGGTDALEAFGLTEPWGTLEIVLDDGRTRRLDVGEQVYGAEHRYARVPDEARVLVLAADLVRPLETGAGLLRERRLHAFDDVAVSAVTVRSGPGARTMARRTPEPGGLAVWIAPGSEGEADPAFASFMDRVGQIWSTEYVPGASADTLDLVLRVEYRGARGGSEPLGFLELYRAGGAGAAGDDPPDFLLRTERTRILSRAYTPAAERVARDVEEVVDAAGAGVGDGPAPVADG